MIRIEFCFSIIEKTPLWVQMKHLQTLTICKTTKKVTRIFLKNTNTTFWPEAIKLKINKILSKIFPLKNVKAHRKPHSNLVSRRKYKYNCRTSRRQQEVKCNMLYLGNIGKINAQIKIHNFIIYVYRNEKNGLNTQLQKWGKEQQRISRKSRMKQLLKIKAEINEKQYRKNIALINK